MIMTQVQSKQAGKGRVTVPVLSDQARAECFLSEGKLRLKYKGRKEK